ncbi:eukaryotic translation initiation factor 4E1 isoform X1 [Drosophila rhopaloa]|uniref:eIF-4F 25 kDa subunit n=1 Tax=Drosophila rhopaloa TaxID=1041015 RepID=A0A6P4EPI8_DRORH|nr:eukaryotic translation initiation factor 4E1 isoform X1 [Drosophila rhopaloa]XP_016975205.1 eukaryotic translation initiation factor 4E1 isoform X1 [Drosophila rhopaloa]XP_016975206.1 eukaryotic translation initiation factor 4E1 isoform X1 [Drosophila rhopaloa]XP_016975207.1 eukaryotic translation initiation factor 4E1 isoform X1 [Drosophila rhopaloa]XP_016975208.1 eukaryotic translation initiation factor 4E1 isoform X1 [Drosophila rhopaloa]
MQSDFHRMKNFANPKSMFKTSAPTSEQGRPEPPTPAAAPAKVAEPKDVKPKEDPQEAGEPAVGGTASTTTAPAGDDAVRTEHLFKHPLMNVWTLWYLENDRTKSWEDMQNEITSFDTVEDFWSLYNHIKPPSEIKVGSDYSLFKKNIRPMWEDAANKQGGRWVITLNKSSKSDLDNLWLDVLLCLIGEAFDHSDQICGAVVNIRGKSNKISIWTANGNNEEAALEIGHKLRDALRLGRNNSLQYQLHKDTMVKQGSNVKSIYTL